MFPRHEESIVVLPVAPEEAFAWLDNFHNLSAHMERPSGMMMGSRMAIETDAAGGKSVGSKVRMAGTMMGLRLSLDEVVTEREPPLRKAWQTVDPRLVVIGPYRLGFELSSQAGKTRLRVFIDYEPSGGILGALLGRTYARWCVDRMAGDAARHFT